MAFGRRAAAQIQSWTPQLVLSPLRQSPANKWGEVLWNALLTACPLWIGAVILGSDLFYGRNVPGMAAVLLSGMALFAAVFAVNSAIHSYLIVKYAAGNKVGNVQQD